MRQETLKAKMRKGLGSLTGEWANQCRVLQKICIKQKSSTFKGRILNHVLGYLNTVSSSIKRNLQELNIYHLETQSYSESKKSAGTAEIKI